VSTRLEVVTALVAVVCRDELAINLPHQTDPNGESRNHNQPNRRRHVIP
jgi:hypothetical protein